MRDEAHEVTTHNTHTHGDAAVKQAKGYDVRVKYESGLAGVAEGTHTQSPTLSLSFSCFISLCTHKVRSATQPDVCI